ncbi:MAG: STAS domain-containing protein [Rhizobiales bacterium]|nr:STAS domain-containing protein [Hyphomicrobiales bacterium]
MIDPPGSGPARLQLPEILDLKAAAPLASQLLSLRGCEVKIDASRVQRFGGLCLQVLLSACCTWRTDGVLLSIVSPSARFAECLALLGASSALSLQA